jgi:hypothetical protein
VSTARGRITGNLEGCFRITDHPEDGQTSQYKAFIGSQSQSGTKLCSGLELAQNVVLHRSLRQMDLPIRAIARERGNTMPGMHYLAIFVAAVAAFETGSAP